MCSEIKKGAVDYLEICNKVSKMFEPIEKQQKILAEKNRLVDLLKKDNTDLSIWQQVYPGLESDYVIFVDNSIKHSMIAYSLDDENTFKIAISKKGFLPDKESLLFSFESDSFEKIKVSTTYVNLSNKIEYRNLKDKIDSVDLIKKEDLLEKMQYFYFIITGLSSKKNKSKINSMSYFSIETRLITFLCQKVKKKYPELKSCSLRKGIYSAFYDKFKKDGEFYI